jgi:ABC-type spermidine/putrescine transport system permease subunit II
MICIDKILLIIIIAPIVIGAFYSLKEKRDNLQDWKPHDR